ncbi:hypothetical protein BAUCODRAFT_74642 [Baudoinia panamericana UAMH 10762]|uniref:Uncharacterized protein n=1 Tax=Baudoinia panamericana (strain UAMH 10762) TaxID=717646 RepID=M2N576_BAUPA|nr:uncharacterized protein BAUCODRAFT_74642 [Baudoinia panamericana UAMH 10762]EMC94189.1 hypothetical protein BAUCODRAFT_74642 [Baudoinia panamericana UAMH 10762]
MQKVDWDPYPLNNPEKGGHLTQSYLWPTHAKFSRSGDSVVGATGTSAYGLAEAKLLSGTLYIIQILFGSIGYATGMAVGVFRSVKEKSHYKRCILVTGEGAACTSQKSLTLTFDTASVLLITPEASCSNNDGYTTECRTHGGDADYNKFSYLNNNALAVAFGAGYPAKYWKSEWTTWELDAVSADKNCLNGACFRFLQQKLSCFDAPANVRLVAAAVAAFNERRSHGTVLNGRLGGAAMMR